MLTLHLSIHFLCVLPWGLWLPLPHSHSECLCHSALQCFLAFATSLGDVVCHTLHIGFHPCFLGDWPYSLDASSSIASWLTYCLSHLALWISLHAFWVTTHQHTGFHPCFLDVWPSFWILSSFMIIDQLFVRFTTATWHHAHCSLYYLAYHSIYLHLVGMLIASLMHKISCLTYLLTSLVCHCGISSLLYT